MVITNKPMTVFVENVFLVLRRNFFISSVNSLTVFTRVCVCVSVLYHCDPSPQFLEKQVACSNKPTDENLQTSLRLAAEEYPVNTFAFSKLLKIIVTLSLRFALNSKLKIVFFTEFSLGLHVTNYMF
jgi:hypothetical protein